MSSHIPRLTASTVVPLLLAAPSLVGAQPAEGGGAGEGSRPEGWRVLTDRVSADTAEIDFARMPPGFHVTTGPAAIFYHPDSTATGTFRVEAEIHLFDPGEPREAYGIFFGGRDLEGSYQAYTYFLVRRTGEYLVKRRVSATSTETLVDWTAHPAVTGWEDREEGSETARNVLSVEAGADELVFRVNGEEVDRLPRSGLDVDGVAGLRVNHRLDVHVSRFEVTPAGAP